MPSSTRRVDAAIGHMDIPAAVNIHAVAVRIDLQVVDSKVIHARRQDTELAAMLGS